MAVGCVIEDDSLLLSVELRSDVDMLQSFIVDLQGKYVPDRRVAAVDLIGDLAVAI